MLKIDQLYALDISTGDHRNALDISMGDHRTVVLLLNQELSRYLPILVGPFEGFVIGKALKGEETDRPMTQQTMFNLLALMGGTVSAVRVSALKQMTYFGVIQIENQDGTKELDARPSDAIALALIAAAPIYVDEEVMARSGKEVPANSQNDDEWLEELKAQSELNAHRTAQWRAALNNDELFTVRAREACTHMVAASEESNHNYIGTEHLLLGLVRANVGIGDGGMAAKILADAGATAEAVQTQFEDLVERGQKPPKESPSVGTRLAHVCEIADVERERLGHEYIGTEHLLLGLIAENQSDESDKQGMAVQILEKLEMDLEAIRTTVFAAIDT